MRTKSLLLQALVVVTAGILLASAPYAQAEQRTKPASLNSPVNRDNNRQQALAEEVRHQLVTLPYYSVFDWLSADVKPDGSVVLMGEVTRPTLKDDAEGRVKRLEAAASVKNNIEVLPLSPMDDQLRVALYRSIYAYNSPLFRYATQSVPPIHIIVRNGHATLKGIVATQGDSDIANIKANGVSGVFSVDNQLQVEGRTDEKISRK
jgi:hyperosmotically inducible periplasmic protein